MTGNAGVCTEARDSGRRFPRFAALALGVLSAVLIAASQALAAPQVNGEFSVSGVGSNNYLTTGPDGNIWVTLDTTNDVARITPAGVVTQYNPTNLTNPGGITTGPDGNLWVTQSNEIAKFSPSNPDGAENFAQAGVSSQQDITSFGGNLWVGVADTVLKIPPAAPTTRTAFTATGLSPRGITASGGLVWVADFTGRVLSVTNGGTVTPYSVGGGVQDVSGGPGTQIAYTQQAVAPHQVGRITPGGSPQKTNIPGTDPFGVTLGADGAYWIGQFNSNNLGRLTPQGGYSTLGGFSAAAGPRRITTGPNDTLWVALDNANKIARVTGVSPPQPTPPECKSSEFSFGKAKKNKKKGTAKLTVEVPCAGDLELAKTKKVKADDEVAEADGEEKLTVKPKGKARKRLNKKGKAKVKAEVTYTPEGGEPNTHTKRVKLVRR